MAGRCEKCNKSSCCCNNNELIPTDRVYYSGPYLPTLKIANGTILTDALIIIDQFLSSFNPPNFDRVYGGTTTATGDGVLKNFTFNHNLGATPNSVVVSPLSKESSDNYSIAFNATTITVSYSVAPSQGDIISWVWVAIRNKA